MAGVVRSHAYYSPADDGVSVEPQTCPVADSHRRKAEEEYLKLHNHAEEMPYDPGIHYLHCTTLDPSGRRRFCPYYYGLADYGNVTVRVDLSLLRDRAIAAGTRGANVYTLCTGAPRNRPPGA